MTITAIRGITAVEDVSSINGIIGPITITGSDGTVLVTTTPGNVDLKVSSTSEVVSLNGLMGALTLANANGVSWTPSGGNTLTPVLGNITPTSVTASGNVSGATLSGTNVGSATLADASTQPLILSGGASPTVGNLIGLAILKTGSEEVFLGINKNSTTGEYGSNALYLSTYTATGLWGIGRGNGAGLIDKADISNDTSGNVIVPRAMVVGRTSIVNSTFQVDGTWQNVATTGVMTLNATFPAGGSQADQYGFLASINTTSGASAVLKKGFGINLNAGYTASAGTIAMIASNNVAGTGTDWVGFGPSFPNIGGYFTAGATTAGTNMGFTARASGSTGINIGISSTIDPSVGAASQNVAVAGVIRPTAVGSAIGALFALAQNSSITTSAAIIGDSMATANAMLILRGAAMPNVTTAAVNMSATFTASSVVNVGILYSPTYNQTSTAGGTDFRINRTNTAVGSGAQLFLDLQIGGTSKINMNTGGAINQNITLGVLNGTTAGTISYSQPFQGTAFKKFIGFASGYENNTAVNQTISFPTAFTNTPVVTANNTGLTISVSTTTLTITAPNSVTLFTGTIIIEGI